MLAESPLLAKPKFVAEPEPFFQLLDANGVVTHRRVGEHLVGCGLTAAAEVALLTVKTELAKVNEPLQLLQIANVTTQLLFQAVTGGGIGLGLGLGLVRVPVAAGGVGAFLLGKPRTLFFFQPATPFNFAAHEDELFDHEVAALRVQEQTSGSEELTPGLVERLKDLLEIELLRSAAITG